MGTIAIPNTFSANTTISSSQVNANFSTIYNEFNGSIAAANLATDAVTTAKIADSNVTTAKIADSNVTTAKLAAGAVTNAKLDTASGGIGAAWQSWVPTYANISAGNGTVVAKYVQIGKTVHFRWFITCGSTTTLATDLTISLPVTANSEYATSNVRVPIGMARGLDVGTANFSGQVYAGSTTVATVLWDTSTSPRDDGTFPWTEASGDTLSIAGTYEAA